MARHGWNKRPLQSLLTCLSLVQWAHAPRGSRVGHTTQGLGGSTRWGAGASMCLTPAWHPWAPASAQDGREHPPEQHLLDTGSSEPGRHKLKDSLGVLRRTASCRMCPTRVAPRHSLQGTQRAGPWPCRSLAPCKGQGQHQARQRLPGKQCRHGFSNFISSFSSLDKLREKAKKK